MRGLRRYDINDEIRLIDTQGFDRQNSEAYYINGWQIFEGETLVMWGRYGTGVVVFSRFDLWRAAIDAFIDQTSPNFLTADNPTEPDL
jgi:hypothetical protein